MKLEDFKSTGVYKILTDSDVKAVEVLVFYYAFYINLKSWNDRVINIIKKRIEIEPVWLLIDDNKDVYKVMITNLNEFDELSSKISELLH